MGAVGVAQEHLICKSEVPSSNPTIIKKKKQMKIIIFPNDFSTHIDES
jgi:hypothetical protein